MRNDAAFRVARYDIGESPTAINPEVPLFLAHNALRIHEVPFN